MADEDHASKATTSHSGTHHSSSKHSETAAESHHSSPKNASKVASPTETHHSTPKDTSKAASPPETHHSTPKDGSTSAGSRTRHSSTKDGSKSAVAGTSGSHQSPAKDGSKSAGASGSGTQRKSSAESVKTISATGRPDTLNSEFVYYSSVLKILTGALTNELDRKRIIPWARKLFRPEYHSSQFREKRNKYLLYLTISLLNDEAFGIFKTMPPAGALPDLEDVEKPEFPAAAWELDHTWTETVDNLSEDFDRLTCSIHCMSSQCKDDHELDNILDEEFQFFLYLLRPYAALLPNTYDRTRVATWMQTLCSITGDEMCSGMRGIRNDYIMALLSYVQNLRLVGPFAEYPPIRKLPPLAEAAKLAAEERPITDPAGPEATDFLSQQPVPDEGAFCYIALTGDLIDSSLPNNP